MRTAQGHVKCEPAAEPPPLTPKPPLKPADKSLHRSQVLYGTPTENYLFCLKFTFHGGILYILQQPHHREIKAQPSTRKQRRKRRGSRVCPLGPRSRTCTGAVAWNPCGIAPSQAKKLQDLNKPIGCIMAEEGWI